MSATVAAALKKIAVYLLTDKKALKFVGGVVLGILIIIIMPIAAILGMFNGSVNIDTNRLHQIIDEKESAFMEDWTEVETAMRDAGYTIQRIQEAEVLFVLVLQEYRETDGFADKLVGCFAAEQTDEQLINAVNAAFGTNLSVSDFTNAMSGIRNAYIDTSGFSDISTKNNLDLVKWAEIAYAKKWGYVWGTYGEVLKNSGLNSLITQYPDEVGSYEDFVRENWLGGRTADCGGLIKGYGWFNAETQEIVVESNGMPSVNANGLYEAATESGTIDTIPEIPGLAVWHDGHIGVYIGNGEVIHASHTTAGVIKTPIGDTGWTHWLKIPSITYVEEAE